MRDHNPITIDDFNGYYNRGDIDSVPIDHFSACNNVKYSQSSVLTRDGIGPYLGYKNVVRVYPYNQSLLILDIDGNIYHTDRASPFTPILSVSGMTDFGFAKISNRAYLTPNGVTNSFIYVYTYGSASPARKAAGVAPLTAPVVTIGPAGNVEQGVHVFAVVYETDTGFLTGLSPRAQLAFPDGATRASLEIPVSPDLFVSKRHVVATKAIDPADFTGNLDGYQFFFVTDGEVSNNTATTVDVNFYDAELLEDASHLEDLLDEIPNCAGLGSYHNRMIAWSFPQGSGGEKISLIRVSDVNEPEAMNEVDGIIEIARDGRPITYCQELRDVLYIFKQTRTMAATDNNDVPSSWPEIVIDEGIGSVAHGVGTVMDAGGINIDFLLVSNFTGINLFNGAYQLPELTWKIRNAWPNSDRASFVKLQLVVNSQDRVLYVVYPDGSIMFGDYNNGLDAKSIKWAPWTFGVKVTSLVLLEEADRIRLIIGSRDST